MPVASQTLQPACEKKDLVISREKLMQNLTIYGNLALSHPLYPVSLVS